MIVLTTWNWPKLSN